jgi:hypothetical protein
MHMGAARWVLSYMKAVLSNFEQTQSLAARDYGTVADRVEEITLF